jgi:hypothetical protein
MHIYFSGRLLTANDLSAEQQASIHHGASSAASLASSDHHAGAPNETLLRSLPASFLDAVALNPQPLPPKDVRDELQRARQTRGEFDLERLEGELNSVGDDAQLANTDLQNILQKQQQTLQMMSNISKMLCDTAMAVIRKIGG